MSIEYKCILTNIGPLLPEKKLNSLLMNIDESDFKSFMMCLMNANRVQVSDYLFKILKSIYSNSLHMG